MLAESLLFSICLTLHALALEVAVVAPRLVAGLFFARSLFELGCSVGIGVLLPAALLGGTTLDVVIGEGMGAVCGLGGGGQRGDANERIIRNVVLLIKLG